MEFIQKHFLYSLTFSNGKIYFGISRTHKTHGYMMRFRQHRRFAERSTKNWLIYSAWRKHGEPRFDVLEEFDTREKAAQAEIEAIAKFDATNPEKGYNLMHGGQGLHAPKDSPMWHLMNERVWQNPERRAKLSARFKGLPVAEATRAAHSKMLADPERNAKRIEKLTETHRTPEVRALHSEHTRCQMAQPGMIEHIQSRRRATAKERGVTDFRPVEGKIRNGKLRNEYLNSDKGKADVKRGNAVMRENPENVAKFEAGRAAWRESSKNAEHCRAMAQRTKEREAADPEYAARLKAQRAESGRKSVQKRLENIAKRKALEIQQ